MRRLHDHCTIEGCERPHKSRGYCQTHYMQYKRGAPITPIIAARVMVKPPECSEVDCTDPVKSRGLCSLHYARYLRQGHTRYRDRKRPPKFCATPGCENILYAKGRCHAHYMHGRVMRKTYGIEPEQYDQMLIAQNGLCAICGRVEKVLHSSTQKLKALAIDHCHNSGVVRGLLCCNCNRAIGLLQDNPALLRKAARYIERAAPK